LEDTGCSQKRKTTPWILPVPPLSSLVKEESPFHVVQPDIHVVPPLSTLVLDQSPSHIVGQNPRELQNIKNMILNLQLDLQEERIKRESLEEKVRRFEGNLTRQSHETPKRKWGLPDKRVPNKEIPQNQSFLPAPNTIKDVDEKIRELKSYFDLRLRSLDQSLLEIWSILANNPAGGPKGGRKTSLEAGPSKDKDYNRFLYKKLERGIFPPQISLKNAIMKSVDELLHKPWSDKTEIEAIMDQYYLDNLPPALLRPDDLKNEDHTPRGQENEDHTPGGQENEDHTPGGQENELWVLSNHGSPEKKL
jgi:hypothetical protein